MQPPKDHSPLQEPTQTPDNVVHVARPIEPAAPIISHELNERHAASQTQYPWLNLSPGEFVISAIRRHPIGLVEIWAIVGAAVLLLFIVLPLYAANQNSLNAFGIQLPSAAVLSLPLLGIIALFVIGAIIATIVYRGNRFFLTNESVVQEIQVSLFSKKEQTISLANIEDASYRQHGILQTLLNYGSIRLSTEGDETTYRFTYVAKPKEHIARLNNAVEAFKNGRPVNGDD